MFDGIDERKRAEFLLMFDGIDERKRAEEKLLHRALVLLVDMLVRGDTVRDNTGDLEISLAGFKITNTHRIHSHLLDSDWQAFPGRRTLQFATESMPRLGDLPWPERLFVEAAAETNPTLTESHGPLWEVLQKLVKNGEKLGMIHWEISQLLRRRRITTKW